MPWVHPKNDGIANVLVAACPLRKSRGYRVIKVVSAVYENDNNDEIEIFVLAAGPPRKIKRLRSHNGRLSVFCENDKNNGGPIIGPPQSRGGRMIEPDLLRAACPSSFQRMRQRPNVHQYKKKGFLQEYFLFGKGRSGRERRRKTGGGPSG